MLFVRRAFFLTAAALLGTDLAPAHAQAAAKPVFSSAYTDFSRDCRPAFTPSEQKEAEERGQDIPLTCKGPGGQAVYVSYSARAASLYVGPAGATDERLKLVATQALDFTDGKGRKLEWRLADGKPFAAILRVVEYKYPAGFDEGVDDPFAPRYARGASLVAVGLAGFETIGFKLDARGPTANAEARRRVDAAR